MALQKNGCGSIYCRSFFVFGAFENTLLEVKLMQNEPNMVLTKAEKQLIQLIRALDFGEVRIMIKDNRPIRVEEIRKSIQLPADK